MCQHFMRQQKIHHQPRCRPSVGSFAGGVFIGSFAGGVGSFAGGATENLADVDMILEKNLGSAHKLFGEFAVKTRRK